MAAIVARRPVSDWQLSSRKLIKLAGAILSRILIGLCLSVLSKNREPLTPLLPLSKKSLVWNFSRMHGEIIDLS